MIPAGMMHAVAEAFWHLRWEVSGALRIGFGTMDVAEPWILIKGCKCLKPLLGLISNTLHL